MVQSHLANQHKRVLVLDGGGFRGLGALLVIDGIMKAVISRARKPLLPCEVFDLTCGTSTGGLIAILLGRLGLDCPTAIKIYKDLAASICGNDEQVFWERLLNSLDTGFESKVYEDALAGIIKKYTGDTESPMITSPGNHGNTKTLVTVTSEAPLYNNRTYCIRSYPVKSRLPPPVDHNWLIREAARGTVASQLFMSPLFIPSKYSYCDAGFAGFNSPVDFLTNEIKELWPNDQVGIIVSIGSDLTSLTPPNPRREWCPTEQYMHAFVNQIVSKLPPSARSSDVLRFKAISIIRRLVILATDTEISQVEITKRFSTQGLHYVRLNPPLGLANTDLADFFHADIVENTVRIWLQGEGKNYISAIASKLVERNTEPLTMDQAHLILPPNPPPNTNPGYNPQLDERRPETMIEYLKNYHVFFVIDDSGSMHGERWIETRDALLEIADHALKQQAAEIDLMFFNSPALYQGIKGAVNIKAIFTQVEPAGLTPTGATLKKILDEHINKLDRAVNTPKYCTIRPLDIIVLTDGVPSDTPKVVLVDAVARMKRGKHHPNAIGVQIVQIGNDPDAIPALKDLMYGDVGSIVDTVPFDGKLSPMKLERILLGGLHPNIRAAIQNPNKSRAINTEENPYGSFFSDPSIKDRDDDWDNCDPRSPK